MKFWGKKKKKRGDGNSLVYGIDVAGFSVYLLNYQHCWKCVLKIQHRCAGISAQRTIPTPHQPPQLDYFDISILEYQKEILKMKLCCHIGFRFKTAVWMLWGSIFQWVDFEDTHAKYSSELEQERVVSCPTRWSLYLPLARCIDHLSILSTERVGTAIY